MRYLLLILLFASSCSYIEHGINPKAFGFDCKTDKVCGDIIGIDCNSAADGDYLYIDKNTKEIISYCGGYCMTGCTNCPPEEWDC
jgi:hypothetical protein